MRRRGRPCWFRQRNRLGCDVPRTISGHRCARVPWRRRPRAPRQFWAAAVARDSAALARTAAAEGTGKGKQCGACGLLSGASKSLDSQMFNEFGSAWRFQQARKEDLGTLVFLQDIASIDDQDLAGDVGSFRRSEEENRGRDFIERARAPNPRIKLYDFFGFRRSA